MTSANDLYNQAEAAMEDMFSSLPGAPPLQELTVWPCFWSNSSTIHPLRKPYHQVYYPPPPPPFPPASLSEISPPTPPMPSPSSPHSCGTQFKSSFQTLSLSPARPPPPLPPPPRPPPPPPFFRSHAVCFHVRDKVNEHEIEHSNRFKQIQRGTNMTARHCLGSIAAEVAAIARRRHAVAAQKPEAHHHQLEIPLVAINLDQQSDADEDIPYSLEADCSSFIGQRSHAYPYRVLSSRQDEKKAKPNSMPLNDVSRMETSIGNIKLKNKSISTRILSLRDSSPIQAASSTFDGSTLHLGALHKDESHCVAEGDGNTCPTLLFPDSDQVGFSMCDSKNVQPLHTKGAGLWSNALHVEESKMGRVLLSSSQRPRCNPKLSPRSTRDYAPDLDDDEPQFFDASSKFESCGHTPSPVTNMPPSHQNESRFILNNIFPIKRMSLPQQIDSALQTSASSNASTLKSVSLGNQGGLTLQAAAPSNLIALQPSASSCTASTGRSGLPHNTDCIRQTLTSTNASPRTSMAPPCQRDSRQKTSGSSNVPPCKSMAFQYQKDHTLQIFAARDAKLGKRMPPQYPRNRALHTVPSKSTTLQNTNDLMLRNYDPSNSSPDKSMSVPCQCDFPFETSPSSCTSPGKNMPLPYHSDCTPPGKSACHTYPSDFTSQTYVSSCSSPSKSTPLPFESDFTSQTSRSSCTSPDKSMDHPYHPDCISQKHALSNDSQEANGCTQYKAQNASGATCLQTACGNYSLENRVLSFPSSDSSPEGATSSALLDLSDKLSWPFGITSLRIRKDARLRMRQDKKTSSAASPSKPPPLPPTPSGSWLCKAISSNASAATPLRRYRQTTASMNDVGART